ncbi:or S-antigen, N-terminal domain-domain-containing protein [Absidia repens]|uniref:Or S-antigen, N-terminal domain-domain-containing protein n=1 Tax=Absidia repens TaxID=90262 RepID=A0A1X2I6V7_9FUNG|nr:or S-antigen, N-terminal domain-domain-containing protein [Absidia repens]
MVHAIRKSVELRIDLEDEPILLMGTPEESAGKMLRGVLHLNTTEPIKVKAIGLRFVGKMKVSWSEGVGHHQHYYKQERNIMEHSWQFIPMATSTQKKTYSLAAGEHSFNFELMLPGDLPQSLDTEGGQVLYRLKAMVERPAFVHNIIKKRYVKVVRSMLPSEFELVQSMEIHNTWVDKMMYDIVMPSKMYALGETITMTFHISPIAPELKVRSICASLKEYCSYTIKDNSKMDARIIHFEKLLDPFCHSAGQWSRDVTLDVPATSPLIFCDTDNEMIKIRHKMKFVISLINADGHLSELRCSVPVVVVDSVADQQENMLPAYDQTWRSVPYDPAVFEALRCRSSVSQPICDPPVSATSSTSAIGIAPTEASTTSSPVEITSSRQPVVGRSGIFPMTPMVAPPNESRESSSSCRAPVTISGRARTLSISTLSASPSNNSFSNSHMNLVANARGTRNDTYEGSQQTDPWWQGMDLSRVPSYNSSANLDHVALSSSLPAYDQISCSPRV